MASPDRKMTMFFYVLGWAVTAIGLTWSFFIAAQPGTSFDTVAAKLWAMSPGLAVMATGLLFVAAAAILQRLDRISDH